jgi:hypothetical protein
VSLWCSAHPPTPPWERRKLRAAGDSAQTIEGAGGHQEL